MRAHIALAVLAVAAAIAATPTVAQTNRFLRPSNTASPLTSPLSSGTPLTSSTALANPLGRPAWRTVTPVPEPAEWSMLVAGLAVVGWMVRRKRNRR